MFIFTVLDGLLLYIALISPHLDLNEEAGTDLSV